MHAKHSTNHTVCIVCIATLVVDLLSYAHLSTNNTLRARTRVLVVCIVLEYA